MCHGNLQALSPEGGGSATHQGAAVDRGDIEEALVETA